MTNIGSAFPEIRIKGGDNYNSPQKIYYGGMSLRDYFAAKALHGLMSPYQEWAVERDAMRIAEIAYEVADAMLQARKIKG